MIFCNKWRSKAANNICIIQFYALSISNHCKTETSECFFYTGQWKNPIIVSFALKSSALEDTRTSNICPIDCFQEL